MTRKSLKLSLIVATAGLATSVGAPVLAQNATKPVPPESVLVVSVDDAIATAQGVFPNSRVVETSLERFRARWVYEVKLARGAARNLTSLREIKVDTQTGQIVKNESERVRGGRLVETRGRFSQAGRADLSPVEAVAIAEAAVPGARPVEVELEREDSGLEYKVKMIRDGQRVEVRIDADTGQVISAPGGNPGGGDPGAVSGFEGAAAAAEAAFPGFVAVKIEREIEDPGLVFDVRMYSTDGGTRRDVWIDPDTGAVLRDRTKSESNPGRNAVLVSAAQAAAIDFDEAAQAARDGTGGADEVREVNFKGATYEVEMGDPSAADDSGLEVKVNATTGVVASTDDDDDDNGRGRDGDDDGPGDDDGGDRGGRGGDDNGGRGGGDDRGGRGRGGDD